MGRKGPEFHNCTARIRTRSKNFLILSYLSLLKPYGHLSVQPDGERMMASVGAETVIIMEVRGGEERRPKKILFLLPHNSCLLMPQRFAV